MRRMMTRDITHTTVEVAEIKNEGGVLTAVKLPNEVIVGNVTAEKAQKLVSKKYNRPVNVVSVVADTVKYEMPVETFMEHATPVVEGSEVASEQE